MAVQDNEQGDRGAGELDTILKSVSEGLAILDSEGVVVHMNAAAEALLGGLLQRGHRVGALGTYMDLHWPDGEFVSLDEFPPLSVLRTAETLRGIDMYRETTAAGRTYLSVGASPMLDEKGAVQGAVATFFDITRLKRAEEVLQRNNALLQQKNRALAAMSEKYGELYHSAPCFYHSLDRDGKLVDVNRTEAEYLGYSREELTGRHVFTVLGERSRKLFAGWFSRVKESGSADLEADWVRKDGTVVEVLMRGVARKDRDERFLYARCTAIDVTERNRLVRELEETNRDLDNFVYLASHDLRTPLRSVASFAAILAADHSEKLDEGGRDCIGRIERGVKRIQRLIQDLQELARLKRAPHEMEDVPVEEVVHTVLERLETPIEQSRARIEIRKPLPVARCSRFRLELVVANLLDNAIKFSSRQTEPPRIAVGSEEDAEFFVLFVQDNGIGIDPVYHEKIYEPFQRLQRSEDYEGTGVGLNIVQRIAAQMGGKTWVVSRPGEGATFYFAIPKRGVLSTVEKEHMTGRGDDSPRQGTSP